MTITLFTHSHNNNHLFNHFKVISLNDDEFELWREFVSDDVLDELFDIETEYEKMKKKEEREKEKERVRAEKKYQKEYLKELKKPKEDLEFDKLMVSYLTIFI